MNKKIQKIFIISYLFLTPVSIFAELSFKELSENIYKTLFLNFFSFLFVVVVVFFAWSIFRFVFASAEEREKKKGSLLWGVVAILVLTSFWGIIVILNNTFFSKNTLGDNGRDFQNFYDSKLKINANFKSTGSIR